MTTGFWKANWKETKQHFVDWWHHDGLLLYIWDLPEADPPHEEVADPGEAPDIEYFYTQPEWRARWNHYTLSREQYPADTFPVAGTMIGPGSLALFLGSEARLSDDTVWFEPCIDPDDPEFFAFKTASVHINYPFIFYNNGLLKRQTPEYHRTRY